MEALAWEPLLLGTTEDEQPTPWSLEASLSTATTEWIPGSAISLHSDSGSGSSSGSTSWGATGGGAAMVLDGTTATYWDALVRDGTAWAIFDLKRYAVLAFWF